MTEQASQTPVVVYSGGRFLSRIGWVGFIICGVILLQSYLAKQTYFDTTPGIQERYHSGAEMATKKIAVISLEGMIVTGDGFIKRQIDTVRKDEDVVAVVLRVNSPGGTVYGSDYIHHHLTKLREERNLPLVVSMGSLAASGGYYVSMAVGEEEDVIFAEPTTTTGSIGVIIPHYDVTGLMEEYGVADDSIATHPRKQMLAMTRKMPEEHRELLKEQIDEMFVRFKEIIHDGRPNLRNDDNELRYNDRDLATGEVFSGRQAKEFGLVDRIGFIEDAIERAMELAGESKSTVRVVRYKDPGSLFSLGLVQSQSSLQAELSSLLEMTTPRAYYLASGIPGLTQRER